MTDDKIEALEERIKELEEEIKVSKSTDSESFENSSDDAKSISRREFLKKAGLGTAGLGALLSPVSADFLLRMILSVFKPRKRVMHLV